MFGLPSVRICSANSFILCFIKRLMLMIRIPSLENCYKPSLKCGAAAAAVASPWASLGAAGISGLGSIASGIIGASTTEDVNRANLAFSRESLHAQREENQLNRDYNTIEAEKARQFTTSERLAQQDYQKQMFDYQTQNALPMALQAADKAGVNPNVLLSKQQVATGSSASAPTGASSPAASFSTGLSPVPFQAQNPAVAFQNIAQGLSSLADAKLKGANVSKVEQEIENLQIDANWKKSLTDGQKILNSLDRIRLSKEDRRLESEISKNLADVIVADSQEKLNKADTALRASMERLNSALADKHSADADFVRIQASTWYKQVQSTIKLQAAQMNEANQNANLANENAKTVKELRSWQVGFEQARTEIAQSESFVKRNTLWETVEGKLGELRAAAMLPEQVEKAIQRAKKENDWFELNQLLGIVDTGVRAAGTYYGAKTGQGFVNAQDTRNMIQSEYNQYLKDKDNGPKPWSYHSK